ncbi:carboxylating nicotinate-nucleotide diphosphorylase [Clostridium perfringens]|uniref:carboxylating nicotinate-nucleotide diphosphorylase n=1 Tax=Clostridium perfringens TaxID=1502 RepID=UPI0018E4270A|nr:carboxylating nicotinate-nucleotide diphosphorylase [Clostridium perfringens]EGT0015096.1 carboxylating nicotinate-nucleotide diphosphorylase [Clostridium perfringens]EGT4137583.1 carboxylating nicotinate-nucleotide diphosphorylase [Clostridium perfringens]EGT4145176.1 carboxylating nicotinate-nucleotide diphosphorylase [Clostridium perfringens]MBI6021522.1 carboxylating nicotinate-nucleotide diphosphorylase [Clostridium perfringens]MDZ5129217.1 carboxylating nicotinate-nucleotide diphospho
MNWLLVEENVKRALNEDLQYGDITTESVVLDHKIAKVDIIAKEKGVIAGTEVFKMVFKILGDVEVDFSVSDGDQVEKGQHFGQVSGDAKKILMGERVALNYMQRMCGIATLTREFVGRLEGTKVKLLDTRKTTPNMRIFEKYAVKVGGGTNHRFGLNDGVMIKDNHIEAAGGIKNAVSLARKNSPFVRKIEVEVESIEQLNEALEAKADIIMLDNMDIKTLKEAVKLIDNRSEVEASGNVTLDNIREIAETGVDFISTGAVTHSFKVLDISMKNFRYID